MRISKSATLKARDVTSACRLVLPGELAKHAVAEGTKCLMKYKKIVGERHGKTFNDPEEKKDDQKEKGLAETP